MTETHHQLGPGQSAIADLADIDLAGPSGVVWALASPQLNANLVTLRAGDQIDEHVNNDVDVLVVTESGTGFVVIDGARTDVGPVSVVLIPRGARRSIATHAGLAYYSIHQRPAGLTVQS